MGKNFKSVVCSFLVFSVFFGAMASVVWADVKLKLPKDVDVVALNGEGTSIENVASLPDGVNQIVIRYDGLLKSADRNSAFPDQVQSAAYVVKFEARDASLQLAMPEFRDGYDVKQFDKNPEIGLTDNGKPVDMKYERLDTQGFTIFRDFERELEKFNKTDSPAAVPPLRNDSWQARTGTVASAEMVAPEMTPAQQAEATSMSVQMLKFWWQQADEASRQQFLDWVKR